MPVAEHIRMTFAGLDKSLYERIGGKRRFLLFEGIEKDVKGFL
jgi:hypothetical protein